MTHDAYKKVLWHRLAIEAQKIYQELYPDKELLPGKYNYRGELMEKEQILPLRDDMNTRENRAATIKEHLGFDVTKALPHLAGLHKYAHHLSSSQLLCMMFFVPLLEDNTKLQEFIFQAFGIRLSPEAKNIVFEYKQNHDPQYFFYVTAEDGTEKKEYEGTSFDLYIKDGEIELFFEIKLTEDGFGKADNDLRHEEKARQYIRLLPSSVRQDIDVKAFLEGYQLYRNIIRANKPNKYVIFITDANNKITSSDLKKIDISQNIIHKTWQELASLYPFKLPFQFNALWDDTSSL